MGDGARNRSRPLPRRTVQQRTRNGGARLGSGRCGFRGTRSSWGPGCTARQASFRNLAPERVEEHTSRQDPIGPLFDRTAAAEPPQGLPVLFSRSVPPPGSPAVWSCGSSASCRQSTPTCRSSFAGSDSSILLHLVFLDEGIGLRKCPPLQLRYGTPLSQKINRDPCVQTSHSNVSPP